MCKSLQRLSIAFVSILCLAVGCGKDPGPPPPLAAEQIPAEMQKVFSKAKPEVKGLVTALISALESKDYPGAFQAVQMLCSAQDLSKEQRFLAARASLTITGLLQAAQAEGDQRAAATLQQHLISK